MCQENVALSNVNRHATRLTHISKNNASNEPAAAIVQDPLLPSDTGSISHEQSMQDDLDGENLEQALERFRKHGVQFVPASQSFCCVHCPKFSMKLTATGGVGNNLRM